MRPGCRTVQHAAAEHEQERFCSPNAERDAHPSSHPGRSDRLPGDYSTPVNKEKTVLFHRLQRFSVRANSSAIQERKIGKAREAFMATMASIGTPIISVRKEGQFYFLMATICAAVAFIGFAPTYWVPLITGRFNGPPVMHLHGLVFFAWALFFAYQSWLAASGRYVRHRRMGLLGVSFATAMVIFGVLAAVRQIHAAAALQLADAGKAFAIVPLAGILFFAGTFIMAIRYAANRDWHQRLMLLAAVSILDAPVARWFITFLAPPGPAGPPPVEVAVPPALVAYLLLVAAMIFDWRTRGRPHKAYVVGGIVLLLIKVGQIPVSKTAGWQSFAGWLAGLAG
jgi:hypothetical protein